MMQHNDNTLPEKQHCVKLGLRLLCNAALSELIVSRTCSVVAEHVVGLGEVLELGVGFGVVWKR
jgi:hypothetical protein